MIIKVMMINQVITLRISLANVLKLRSNTSHSLLTTRCEIKIVSSSLGSAVFLPLEFDSTDYDVGCIIEKVERPATEDPTQ
jgi:hypothetical protein